MYMSCTGNADEGSDLCFGVLQDIQNITLWCKELSGNVGIDQHF